MRRLGRIRRNRPRQRGRKEMMKTLRGYGLAAALVAGSVALAAPAEARDRHDGDDTAAIAIGAGIVGLAIGAMIADRDDHHYYDRGYYHHRRYVSVAGYPGHYYYYDGYPNRYYRDRYYDRYYRSYYERRHYNRWDRGYYDNRWHRGHDRVDRWYGRGGDDHHRRHHRRDGDRRWHD